MQCSSKLWLRCSSGNAPLAKPWNNRLGSRSQTSALKTNRHLDHAHAMGRDHTGVGGSDVILIWRLYLPRVEPGISRSLVGITTVTPWMLSSSSVKSRIRLPGDIIFRLRLHQNLDPVDRDSESRRSISCGILLFFPTDSLRCRPHRSVHSLNGSIILDGRTDMIRTLRTSWGTQAIDYSWANLMNTIPHKLHPEGFRMLM